MADIMSLSRAERTERQFEFFKAVRDGMQQALARETQSPLASLQRTGVQGRAKRPAHDVVTLMEWQRRSELVFGCVEKIADAAMDPVLVIQELDADGNYQPYNATHRAPHPLASLLAHPNEFQDEIEFRRAWVVSEHIAGVFYAEIVRNNLGLPIALYPLNPAKVVPLVTAEGELTGYDFINNGRSLARPIPPENMLVRKAHDITNPHGGLPPLLVALGSVDADAAQTDYIRSFFAGGGQPSGIISVPTQMGDDQMEQTRQQWTNRYSRRGAGAGPAVLQNGSTYQKIGANLDEIDSSELRQQFEARICGVFGVPPVLVGAYVGLKQSNNRASAKAAQEDFWVNKMSPLFTRWRSFLSHRLLSEFEGSEAIVAGKIRCAWDMSTVMALQEDSNDRHKRALEALQSGAITLNQYRAQVNQPADDNGDVYYLPAKFSVVPAKEIGNARGGQVAPEAPPAE
ncbi:MAG: phage portal protein [Pyrinomonadaceae bacterium MAG19_C2-C3]|nr:phage portal protein [Pyrinomonadaceae bacterium MAG19_C2-C3]